MKVKIILTIFLCIFIFLRTELFAVMSYGHFREYRLDNATEEKIIYKDPEGLYEYIAYKNLLLFNIKSSGLESVKVDNIEISAQPLTFKIAPSKEWKIDQIYLNNSGTAQLHKNQIYLPDCAIGNVCIKNNTFSVFFPNEVNPQKVKFFINNKDITTLFYYDSKSKLFRIKEYNEGKFFNHFKTDIATLAWKFTDKKSYDGTLRIFLGKNTVKGKVTDDAGVFPPDMEGRAVILSYPGSKTIAPHKLKATLDSEGKYTVSGLPTLDYHVEVDLFPYILPDIVSADIDDNCKVLEMQHIIPSFDRLLSMEGQNTSGGEFIVMSPGLWDDTLSGEITSFVQLAGDYTEYAVDGLMLRLIIPTGNTSGDDFVFWGESGGKKFILVIPGSKVNHTEHTQFGLFNWAGEYAKTKITGLEGNVFIPGRSRLSMSVESMYNISGQNVKGHYYYENGKAIDITDMFKWSGAAAELTLDNKKVKELLGLLDHQGTIAATFCRDPEGLLCYRIKSSIRPALGDISVELSGNLKENSRTFLILKELHIRDNPVIRVMPAMKKSVFSNIPAGSYQILLADLDFNFYGSVLVDIDAVGVKKIKLAPKGITRNTPLWNITGGVTVYLSEEPVMLQQNDSEIINLRNYSHPVEEEIKDVKILGKLPAEYKLYKDNSIMFKTGAESMSSSATLMFDTGNIKYLLPVVYLGDDYPLVREQGMDYSMCPKERPYCVNAFLQFFGLKQGIYNGRKPFVIILPFDFKPGDIKIYMESDVDMTGIFYINPAKRSITLKNDFIPTFLSTLATNTQPVTLVAKNRIYYISVIPGYKKIEATIMDEDGAQTSAAAGLTAKISCIFAPGRYFSQLEKVLSSSVVFDDLPDCKYSLDLIDSRRIYGASADNLVLSAGQNTLRTVLPLECLGDSDDLYISNCRPFMPIFGAFPVTPYAGVYFFDKEMPLAYITPDDNLFTRYLGRGILIYDNATEETNREIKAIDEDGEEHVIYTYRAIPAASGYITQTPGDIKIKAVNNISQSMTYSGKPFNIEFLNVTGLSMSGINVFLNAAGKQHDVKNMFYWDGKRNILYLRKSESGNFTDLLEYTKNELIISIGNYYEAKIKLYTGASDIVGILKPDYAGEPGLKSPVMLLAGIGENTYRQTSKVSADLIAHFYNVPYGEYNLIFFDNASGVYGYRELEIQEAGLELYVEVGIKRYDVSDVQVP